MKTKILIIFLFILFAFPIPLAILGTWSSLMLYLLSATESGPFVLTAISFLGVIVGSTYLVTYTYALIKTWREKKLSIKTFLPLAHCFLALLYVLSIIPAISYFGETTEYFGFSKKDFVVVDESDTHDGFHGDGYYYFILDCSDNKEEALEIVKGWKKLPLSENLNLIMYGGEKDGVKYSYELAEDAHIPKIENGYYIFEDRFLESTDSTDDSVLFDRYSFNFSISIYDCDTDKMYYYELDT